MMPKQLQQLIVGDWFSQESIWLRPLADAGKRPPRNNHNRQIEKEPDFESACTTSSAEPTIQFRCTHAKTMTATSIRCRPVWIQVRFVTLTFEFLYA